MTKEEFRAYQVALKLNGRDLANLLGKSERQISNYRTGREDIPILVWKFLILYRFHIELANGFDWKSIWSKRRANHE